jgi:hypothetical protein
MHIEKEE